MREFAHASGVLNQSADNPAVSCAYGPKTSSVPDGRLRRENARERLVALGEMTGSVAHDFRNLLAVIEAGLRLAEKNLQYPEMARTYIAASRDGVDKAVKLTAELLSFAKQQKFESRISDVNVLLCNLEVLLGYSVGPKARVMLDLGANIPKCAIDPSQFDAAILNLVVNARDAMPNGGDICIRTEMWAQGIKNTSSPPPGRYVRVRVSDNGTGMPKEVLEKIFDLYFTTKGARGTGMGLPHICAYLRLVGGHMSVSSEVGMGTAVDLYFPSVGHPLEAHEPISRPGG